MQDVLDHSTHRRRSLFPQTTKVRGAPTRARHRARSEGYGREQAQSSRPHAQLPCPGEKVDNEINTQAVLYVMLERTEGALGALLFGTKRPKDPDEKASL